MLNVTEKTKNAYLGTSDKKLVISFPDANIVITNDDIVSESCELNEGIETERSFTFKGCIASQIKFKCADIIRDLRDEYIEASIQADDTEAIPLFKGYVKSQENLTHEDILTEFICYDALYSKGERDMQSWVDGLSLPMTVKQFRTALFAELGITQENNTFINDSLSISEDFKAAVDKPSARELMQWLCQINARFGQIGRDGIFYYRELTPISRGLYPSTETYPSEETYPSAESAGITLSPSYYQKLKYEPYETAKITKVVIVDKDGVERGSAGSGTNIFVIKDNPIAYCVNMAQATRAILAKIDRLNFDPVINLETVGLPWIECGDAVMAYTRLNTVRAFVLSRTLKGIQALSDSFSADTDQYQPIYKPTVQTQISQTNTALAQTNSNVTSVNNRVSTVDSRVTTVDSRVTGVQGQVTQLGTVVAQKANITDLNATNATVQNLNATKANVSDLNATNAAVQSLNANKASIAQLNATNARINTLSAKAITTDNLMTNIAQASLLSTNAVNAKSIFLANQFYFNQHYGSWKSASVRLSNGGTQTIYYLGYS